MFPTGRVLFSVLLDGQRTEKTTCTDAEAAAESWHELLQID